MDYIYTIIIIIAGFLYANSQTQRENDSNYVNIYLYHLLFTFVYLWFVSNRNSDAISYYLRAARSMEMFVEFDTGTGFMDYINTPLVQFFSLGKYSIFTLYGFISYYGFVFYYKLLNLNSIRIKRIYNIPIHYILFFLPGMHFWTAGLGKDGLIFTSVMLVIYSFVTNPFKNKIHLIIAITLIVCIRPHIMILFLCALVFVYGMNSVTSFNLQSILIVAVMVGGLVALFPLFSDFVKLSDASVEGVNNQFDRFNSYGARGIKFAKNGAGSSLDISGYPLPYKIFSFLFRPLFYDARSVIQLIASVENFILLSLLFNWIRNVKIVSFYKSLPTSYKGVLWYVVLGAFVFGMTLYNLGLASRQKFMIVPELLLMLVILIKNEKQEKN